MNQSQVQAFQGFKPRWHFGAAINYMIDSIVMVEYRVNSDGVYIVCETTLLQY